MHGMAHSRTTLTLISALILLLLACLVLLTPMSDSRWVQYTLLLGCFVLAAYLSVAAWQQIFTQANSLLFGLLLMLIAFTPMVLCQAIWYSSSKSAQTLLEIRERPKGPAEAHQLQAAALSESKPTDQREFAAKLQYIDFGIIPAFLDEQGQRVSYEPSARDTAERLASLDMNKQGLAIHAQAQLIQKSVRTAQLSSTLAFTLTQVVLICFLGLRKRS